MTVQEFSTLHTKCELERNQLLTILAMSVQNSKLAGFLLTGNRSNFLSNSPPPGFMTVLISYLLYTKPIDALTEYLYTLKVL